MFEPYSLQSLFCDQFKNSSSPFMHSLGEFITCQTLPSRDHIEDCRWQEPLLCEEKIIENWKQLLTVNIFCSLSEHDSSDIAIKVRQFEKHPWNKSSQYLRSLIALNHALAKMPIPETAPHLLESGAALIDLHEYCPWLALPYVPYHFEFGIFVSLLALLTKKEDLKAIALRIAKWQINTLDIKAAPLQGLFVRENEGKKFPQLCLSYLFFRCASILNKELPFSAIAEKTMISIQEYSILKREEIDPLWVLIEKWLDQYQVPSSKRLELSENIYDPSTALVGYRSTAQHCICTLHGVQTGLGSLKYEDIEIISYGPQYLPLGECQGFGIEGNALSDQGMRRSMIEWRKGSFTLKGCTRLVDQPSSSLNESAKFRGIWLEVTQEFAKPHFYLKTSFLGMDGWDSVAFSFFVKANSCKIQSQILRPQMLEKYQGEAKVITLEGTDHFLDIRPLSLKGTMQVIPLAGGDNFWGADFLIAYFMTSDQRLYQWHIGPSQVTQ